MARLEVDGSKLGVLVVLFFLVWECTASLPPGTECIPILTELEPCLPFVQKSGEKPTPLCCSVLKDVHNKSASCLCRLIAAEKNQPPTPGINLTLAFLLPNACHLTVNPNRCPALLSGDPPFSYMEPQGGSDSNTPTTIKPSLSSSYSRLLRLDSHVMLWESLGAALIWLFQL